MFQRVHSILLDTATNRFAPLGLDHNAAAAVNPAWPSYSQVCTETWELFPRAEQWVLRAHLRCCCSGACPYGHGAGYAAIPAVPKTPGAARTSPHGRDACGPSYVQAEIGASDLTSLAKEAKAKAADEVARTALGATIAADASALGLSAAELDGELAGALTPLADGPVAAGVFAGSSSTPNDYYVVAVLVKLHQRLVAAAHSRLTRDWPQRGDNAAVRI